MKAGRIHPQISPPWRVAIFLSVAAGLNYADRTALASVIPPLRTELGATDVQVGLAGMLFLWSYAIASPFAGSVADRWSRRRIVTWSLVGWSVVTVATGFAPSVLALIALRIALGLAESFYLPAAAALLGDCHTEATRGRAMGTHILGLNLGLVIGGASAGWLAEHFGWRVGFWVLGTLGILLAMGSGRYLRAPSVAPAPSSGPATRRPLFRSALRYFMRVPTFHCLLICAIVTGIATWIFLSWLPLFFAERYGLKLAAAGLAGVALYKGPVFLGIAVGGWLSDRVVRRDPRGRVMVKALSFLLSAPFLYFFIGAPTFLLVATMMVVSSLIRAVGLPNEHAIVCEVIPVEYRATAIGMLNTAATAAGGLAVLVAGVLKKDVGLGVIFGSSSFGYIFAGLVMLVAYWFFMSRDMVRADAFSGHA